MSLALFVEICPFDSRWHGAGEWPPSPMRVFQALVAAAGSGGGKISEEDFEALKWLEKRTLPVIGAPVETRGRRMTLYVPNNDLDTVGGDPARVGKIRTGKTIHPYLLFSPNTPFLFLWPFEKGDRGTAEHLLSLAERLYQFGRGVDMAYARAEILPESEVETRLAAYPGQIWRPGEHAEGTSLRCPEKGTLTSLLERHAEQAKRVANGVLQQAMPARFRMVGYDSKPIQMLFELMPAADSNRRFQPWPLSSAAALTERVRDQAASRLVDPEKGLPALIKETERFLIGRGANDADKKRRIRIIPLPSIGHDQADPAIRRLLVEIPPSCPLNQADIEWAFSGMDINLDIDPETGEIRSGTQLVSSADTSMLKHYGIGTREKLWRSITPVALPVAHCKGRVSGAARHANENRAAAALQKALRHAGIVVPAEAIRLQREPFRSKGEKAEKFALLPRFTADRLWHAEILFTQSVKGPLLLGNGRYFGLGLFAPAGKEAQPAPTRDFYFTITSTSNIPITKTMPFALLVKTALLSKGKFLFGKDGIPSSLSGHERDGSPLRRGAPKHIFLFPEDRNGDGRIDHLHIHIPKSVSNEETRKIEEVIRILEKVHMGEDGTAYLNPAPKPDANTTASVSWETVTPYMLTRFPKGDYATFLTEDVIRQCRIVGLPVPKVEILDHVSGSWETRRRKSEPPGSGNNLCLTFPRPICEPLALGRHRHLGLGLFRVFVV